MHGTEAGIRAAGIRAAGPDDLHTLQEIERAAGEPFRQVGMAAVADDPPPPIAVLAEFAAAGRAWVVERDGGAVAYLLGEELDGNAHIEQLSVHPDHARRRLGRALIEHYAGWAQARGHAAMTLTTFVDVAWNGPYYERCGFRWLAEHEITPQLRDVRDRESQGGLDRWPRGCMRRELGPAAPNGTWL